MHVRLEAHRDDHHPHTDADPEIYVDNTHHDSQLICLSLDPLSAETFDDQVIYRHLEPGEARDIAAMLTLAAELAEHRGARAGLR